MQKLTISSISIAPTPACCEGIATSCGYGCAKVAFRSAPPTWQEAHARPFELSEVSFQSSWPLADMEAAAVALNVSPAGRMKSEALIAAAPQGLQGLQAPQGLQGLHGLQAFAAQGLQGLHALAAHGLQGLHGLQALAAHGLQGLHGLQALAAHGLQGLHGLHALAAQGLQGLHGLQALAAQGLQGLQGLHAAATSFLAAVGFAACSTLVLLLSQPLSEVTTKPVAAILPVMIAT